MNIKNAEYVLIDKHPYLRLIVDDKEALIGEFKYSILQLGYVPLTSKDVDWAEILPPIKVPATESTGPLALKGFTNDPVIIKMSYDFWKAINFLDDKKFIEGPVEIPHKR